MANLLVATRESDSLRSENPKMSQPSRGLVELGKKQDHALPRRPPFQRSEMAEWVKPAPVGFEQGRGREVRDQPAQAVAIVARVGGRGQAAVAGEKARGRDGQR